MNKKQRIIFYAWTYVVISILAIIGLIINIKTVSINEKSRKMQHVLQEIKQENEGVQLKIMESSSLNNIEQIGKSMGLETPKKFFNIPYAHSK